MSYIYSGKKNFHHFARAAASDFFRATDTVKVGQLSIGEFSLSLYEKIRKEKRILDTERYTSARI